MATSQQYGAFVPSTFILDVAQLQQANVNSPEFKELLVRLYQNLNLMCNVLNIKDTALYPLQELVNGQLWFPNPLNTSATAAIPSERQVIRKVFNLPVIAGAALPVGVTTILHNITVTPKTTFTRIYGVANDTTGNNYYPIPWASAAGVTNIEIRLNATQIIITNNSGVAFNNCYVIVEFIQS